jgi:hypothetical protein
MSGERVVLVPRNMKSLILSYADGRPVLKFETPRTMSQEKNINSLLANAIRSADKHNDEDTLQVPSHNDIVKSDNTEIVLT